jgi:hypothetical protein
MRTSILNCHSLITYIVNEVVQFDVTL